MLLLRITRSANNDRPTSVLDVLKVSGDQQNLISTYEADGHLPDAASYVHSRLILNDAFDTDDIRMFGRYGILEFSSEQAEDDDSHKIYISGGKWDEPSEPTPGLLRLSREDHRHLLFLRRSDETMSLRTASNHAESFFPQSPERSPVLTRLLQIAGATVGVGTPFFFPVKAAAQCSTSANGTAGSAVGNGYAIDGTTIQTQEGGTPSGNVPAAGSGSGSSGVTYYGFDLGQQNSASMQKFQLSQSLLNTMNPFVGKQGSAAISAYNAARAANPNSVVIGSAQRQQIYSKVYPVYYSAAAASMNLKAAQASVPFQFSSMPVQWQTVTASMFFQSHSPSVGTSGKFMNTQFVSQIIHGQYSAAYSNLQHWSNNANDPQTIRAAQNAKYLSAHNCTGTSQ